MKIAVLNAEAGGNKGAEAMLEILVIKLLSEVKGCEIYLEVSSKTKYYSEVFLDRFKSKNIHLLPFKPKNILNPYGSKANFIDVAIDIGGINFTGNSKKAIFRNLVRFYPFTKNGKKLIFFTQDLGPSKSRLSTIVGSYILSKADGVFTRSQLSYNEAINTFGIDNKKVYGPSPDSTLLYHPSDNYELNTKKEYIVFCPSAIMYAKHGENYLNLFERLFQKLSAQYDVVILVHNFTENFGNSDERVCQILKDRCPSAILINENISTGKLKQIQANSVFSISSRYHVVVGSISRNVPSIAIGWNPKYESYLRLYGKEDWNVDFNENSYKEIEKIIDDSRFLHSTETLRSSNLMLERRVADSFEKLFSLIR